MPSKGSSVNFIESPVMSITQMTGVGVSDEINVAQYKDVTVVITVAGLVAGPNVVRLEMTLDGTNWASWFQGSPRSPTVAGGDITLTEDGSYVYNINGKAKSVRLRVVSETDTAVTYDMDVQATE